MCKNDYSWSPSTCICENGKYVKSTVVESVIMCNEIINVTNDIPTNVTNTLLTNVTSTVSINSDDKKVRYKMHCYIFHTILLGMILLLTTAIIFYHYAKY